MTSSSESRPRTRIPVGWYRRVQPRRVLAALGLLALCDLGFYTLGVRPAEREERRRIARNAELSTQVQEARQGFEAVEAAVSRIETARTEGSELVEEIALARRSAFSSLLTELGEASSLAGIEIRETSYSVEPIEGTDEYGILAVNANFRGSYDNLVRFLYRLDGSDLFFIIGSLAATPRDEGNSAELRINMRFDTLVRGL